MHETGCPGLVHWDDPEGWDGEVGSGWRHMYTRGGFKSMNGKTNTGLYSKINHFLKCQILSVGENSILLF